MRLLTKTTFLVIFVLIYAIYKLSYPLEPEKLENGLNLVHKAAMANNHMMMDRYIKEYNIDVNTADNEDNTPFTTLLDSIVLKLHNY